MNRHIVAALAGVVASTLAAPSLASTAVAGLTDFQVQLVDLDAGDQVVPSVTFQDVAGGSFVAAESGVPSDVFTDTHFGGAAFAPASATSARDGAAADGSMSGDVYGAGARVATSTSATRADTYGASTVQLGDGSTVLPFTLSARTRLVITGDASASALSTFADASADTWASVFLKLTDVTGLNDVSADGVYAEQAGAMGATGTATTDAHRIEISFDNLTAFDTDGLFFGSVDAYSADIAPVPEPGVPALMLGALGLLAWRARRHSR